MYDNFILRQTENGNIGGYTWPLENPDKVVCLIHGIGEYAGRYDRMAKAFHVKNIAVLSMDLRGHGISMNKWGHCAPRADVLNDITVLIRHAQSVYPNVPIVLYGHSMGGNITMDYRFRGELNDVPVGYVISAPWIRLVRAVPGILYVVVKAASKIVPSMIMSAAVNEDVLGHPDSVKPYNKNPMVHDRISLQTAYDGFTIGLAMENGTHENNGKAKDIPTLVMHGTEDKICSIDGTRAMIAKMEENGDNVKFIEWEGLYHEIHNGGQESKGDEVIENAGSWISQL